MAVPAITLDFPIAQRVGNRVCGLISGSVNITSYDTAHPAVTALTGLFKPSGKLRVSPVGVSSNGYAIRWDNATNSFKAYSSNGAAPAALVEAPNTTAVGTFDFIAMGQLG
jgi:hypothetical protein